MEFNRIVCGVGLTPVSWSGTTARATALAAEPTAAQEPAVVRPPPRSLLSRSARHVPHTHTLSLSRHGTKHRHRHVSLLLTHSVCRDTAPNTDTDTDTCRSFSHTRPECQLYPHKRQGSEVAQRDRVRASESLSLLSRESNPACLPASELRAQAASTSHNGSQ